MRILFLTHRLPYAPNRGDRIRAYHLLRTLQACHEVHLVSLVHDSDEARHLPDVTALAASATGVRVNRWRQQAAAAVALMGAHQPLTHVLLHSPRMRSTLTRIVTDAKPEVVVAYCTGMARYALEPPLERLPFVLDMVDVDSEKWARLAESAWPALRWIYRREASLMGAFEARAIERAAATVVVTDRERRALGQHAAERIVVIGNGVDTSTFAPAALPQSEPRVIFCGVFDYGPNEAGARWVASEVWPQVVRMLPAAQLDLVGMNPSRTVRALAADRSIRVTDAVPDVRPYLSNAAIAIAPLRVARGVQNKVLEAVAAGLPCVVTPPVFDGLPAAVRPACIVAGDAPAFAAAMGTLLGATAAERRAVAMRADLSELAWPLRLRPFLRLIEDARRSPVMVDR